MLYRYNIVVNLSHTMITDDIIIDTSRRQYQNKPQPSGLTPSSPQKTILFIPSRTKTQKIKIIDHRNCYVRADK